MPLELQSNLANSCRRIMFIFPLIVKIHSPYCSLRVLLSIISLCVSSSVICTVLMMMSAHLNDEIIQLHKLLSSLHAHLVSLNKANYDEKRDVQFVYSEHSVWYLRQELSYLKQFQNQYLPEESFLVIRFSFAELLKLLFWLSMIILSLFTQTKKDPDKMRDTDFVLADPLRLLNGIKFDV